jgi:hypothetical protein
MIKKMYIGLHVKYPLFLSDFKESCIFSTDFEKSSNVKLHENPLVGPPLFHADGQTDMTKLIVAFRNFVNAPKYVTKLQTVLTLSLHTPI